MKHARLLAVLLLFTTPSLLSAEDPRNGSNRFSMSLWELGVSDSDVVRGGYYLRGSLDYMMGDVMVTASYAANLFHEPLENQLMTAGLKVRLWDYSGSYSVVAGPSYLTNPKKLLNSNYWGVFFSPLSTWNKLFQSNGYNVTLTYLPTTIYFGANTRDWLVTFTFLDFALFY